VKSQITHLTLSVERRRVLAMRASQLQMSLSEYVGRLIDTDAKDSGLTHFLGTSGMPEVRNAKR